MAALLALAVLAVYAPVRDHEFVEFDDPLYVTENPQVRQGVTGPNLVWALTSMDAHLLHPLTWTSYMVDVDLWGVERAGPFALTNAVFHAATAALLFLLLRCLTGRLWPSAFAAALFALHPLRVESVAWVSQRKDVLSGLFLILTLWAYAGYARHGGVRRYALTAGTLLLGLLSKPTLVTVPVLLLLLDAWPLARLGRVALRQLVLEKLPLLALCLGVAGVGIWMMGSAPNVWGEDPSLLQRLAGAPVVSVFYLGKILWPTKLAVVYPDPLQQGLPFWTGWQIGGALALLVMLTAGAAAVARRAPAVLVGWLWYGIALLPVIGLVPFGIRVMNDRHTYLPMLGLALAAGFGLLPALEARHRLRHALVPLAALVLVACAGLSWRQVSVWRDSTALFDRALAVTERNAIVHFSKAVALGKRGETDAAIREFRATLAIHPGHADAHNGLGWLLQQRGESEEAVRHYRRALELRPGYVQALLNLGNQLGAEGDRETSLALLQEAVQRAPQLAHAHYWLGAALESAERVPEATAEYRQAVAIDPEHVWSHARLGRLLEQRGRTAEALAHYQAVLSVREEDADALRGTAWILATGRTSALRDPDRAVALAEQLDGLTGSRSPVGRYTLAAAYAAAGRTEEAATVLREVLLELTPADEPWAPELRRCLALYEAGLPYRRPLAARE
jgi:tetratricopeptide (TPR) repeat protein